MAQAHEQPTFPLYVWVIAPALLIVAWLLGGPPLTPWDYEPIIDSRAVIGLVALGLIFVTVLAPTYKTISPPRRMTLSAVRLGIVMLVVLFMLRPTCFSTRTTQQSATLLLLLDQSRSMTLPHESEQQSRWQAQFETLRQNEALLKELSNVLELKMFAYDTELHPIELKNGEIVFPEAADGDYTDIGSPLYDAVTNERSNRLLGVILMGDGVQTVPGNSPRVEIWEVGEELARLDQPLYTVAYGPEGSVTDARDVAVVNLLDQYTVFVKTELLVQATIHARGFENAELPVELIIEDTSGNEQIVDRTSVSPSQDDQQMNVELSYSPQKTGQYRLTVRAVPQEKETVVKNNELSAFLTVLGGGLRVLYLEGALRSEQKFLRRALDASQDIELDFQWIDHRLRDRWPLDLSELFSDPQYDVFIIGDLDSQALFKKDAHEATIEALVKAVEGGKGLMMLGGFHSFGPGRYANTRLADVLPVRLDKNVAQDFGTSLTEKFHENRPLQMVPKSPHFLTRLAAGEENLRAWQQLPPLDGANKFEKEDVKPRSIIHLESPDGVPLLISGEVGGRVLAFAGDSTWRWALQGQDDKHRRFWRQVILWLSRRDELDKEDVWIKLAQRRFDPGAKVEFTTGARSGAGDPIRDAKFEAIAVLPDGKRKAIALTSADDEQKGLFDDTRAPGTYLIEITATRDGKELGKAKAKFMVYDHDVELAIPEANHDQLARMARQTKGRPVAPEELTDLLNEIKHKPQQLKVEIPIKWQLGDVWEDPLFKITWPTAWIAFLLMTVLLTVEWYLRKKWGLV